MTTTIIDAPPRLAAPKQVSGMTVTPAVALPLAVLAL
jgi:hypothetical protein